MHDIRAIRDNRDAFITGWNRRKSGLGDVVSSILELDEKLRAAVSKKQEAEQARNAASKLIGKAKGQGDEAEAQRLMDEVAAAKQVMEIVGEEEAAIRTELETILAGLPNIPRDDVPEGADEADNEQVRSWGEPTALKFDPKDHADLGEALGMMDFETAAKMSGARFVLLSGKLAKLERALTQFMLDVQTEENGYVECSPPLLVKDNALFGTGQLPKFEEDLFKTTVDNYLIPTAEVSLTNIVAETTIAEDYLPRRYTAATPCFRSEAGSAGRDTKGMIRLHQFTKVELVSVVKPEDSDDELERMTGCAEAILQKLELPYRVMKLCTGDMGFGAQRTYDLEVWLPSQDTYREISSCSTCGDFQARRMNARFKRAATEENKKPKPEFVHTLNGSGLAVGRTLVAVLENYQREDGSIAVPEVLQNYMGGLKVIEA
ncbi:MAG: serine--tRNA ligase [Hirschia sp.]|nr:serine--tRNA ligase [Hirschia sp.]MBF19692.1 serine--tRNA ligase [Hirschia sp.]